MNIFICFDILYCGHRNDIHFMMCILINTKVRKMEKYLEYFYEIASIPHGSGNIKAISDYLKNFAMENGFYVRQDEKNNIVIIRDAHPELADHEPVILQGHMDMVAVKTADTKKNMEEEGLDLYVEDNVLRARGTSLGGDDGIAVAYIMAILTGEYKTPRIEAIITVDEEIGMLGASFLDVKDITAKRMINIDQEEEGIFIVSCAGGATVDIDIPVEKEVKSGNVYSVLVSGLKGGHSGVDINKNRGNAIKIMADELSKLKERIPFALIEFNGGVAENAIPNSAEVKLMLTDENLNSLFEKEILGINGMDMYFGDEKAYDQAVFAVSKVGYDEMIVLKDESTDKVLNVTKNIPYGIISMNESIEDMVQTSLNTGIIKSKEDSVALSICIRSSVESEKKELIYKVCKIAKDTGASYEVCGDYAGWNYSSNSELENYMVRIYEEMFSKKPRLEAIHAGLECGVFKGKIPELQCISIGPDINNIHSVNENLPLDSADRCFNYLVKVLEGM